MVWPRIPRLIGDSSLATALRDALGQSYVLVDQAQRLALGQSSVSRPSTESQRLRLLIEDPAHRGWGLAAQEPHSSSLDSVCSCRQTQLEGIEKAGWLVLIQLSNIPLSTSHGSHARHHPPDARIDLEHDESLDGSEGVVGGRTAEAPDASQGRRLDPARLVVRGEDPQGALRGGLRRGRGGVPLQGLHDRLLGPDEGGPGGGGGEVSGELLEDPARGLLQPRVLAVLLHGLQHDLGDAEGAEGLPHIHSYILCCCMLCNIWA